MIFWDSSAVVPLLVEEDSSSKVQKILKKNSKMVVWWGTTIECVSALSRLERLDILNPTTVENALDILTLLRKHWREVLPTPKLKNIAERLLRTHPLTSADAQQLAACIIFNSEYQLNFITFDQALTRAAKKEGLICI